METDSLFYQLLKHLPDTLFKLLDLQVPSRAKYRFDALEIKKSYRLDGLFVPKRAGLPLYFVEVQYQKTNHFYANLFAKVFSYLDANDPEQEWMAVALFGSRSIEPEESTYGDLLASRRVRRIYLDEATVTGEAPPGLMILQLISCPEAEAYELVEGLRLRVRQEPDCGRADVIIELMYQVLIRRYPGKDREDLRHMFKLHDIRETRVWKEAHEEGVEEGLEKGKQRRDEEHVERLKANGKTLKEISELLGITLAEVRRLAKKK